MLISKLCRIQEISREDAGMRLSGGRIPALAKTWSRWVMEWVWRGEGEERGLDRYQVCFGVFFSFFLRLLCVFIIKGYVMKWSFLIQGGRLP